MERRAFLYGALVDAPQGVYRPPVRREIFQWGRGPFGGTIEDNHFPKLQLFKKGLRGLRKDVLEKKTLLPCAGKGNLKQKPNTDTWM